MKKADRLLFAAGAIFIAAYFLLLTRQAVQGYFSPDDLMNLHRAWSFPLGLLFKGNILFFLHSPYYRPLGEAWYRIIYFFAGFHPQPFHVANLAIQLANLFLTYSVARRLSNSRAAGALAVLLMSYHGRLIELYFDTGLIYDVLCYFFYFSALAWYLRIRQQKRLLRWGEIAGCCVLYICALNAKELAVSLPVFLLAYELLFQEKAEGWFVPRRWWPVLATGILTVMFIAGRILEPQSLMSNVDAYKPLFAWSRFMETSVGFTGNVLYTSTWFTPAKLLLLWAAMLAYASVERSRTLQFAWLFFMITPLPVAFLMPRGGPQYYIPLFGWALYAAATVVEGIDLLARKLPAARRPSATRAACAVLLVGIAGTVYAHEKDRGMSGAPSVALEGSEIRSTTAQLHALYPKLPLRSRLFFLHDPLTFDWNLYFLVKLSYGDDTLVVETGRNLRNRPTDEQLAAYDHVFDLRGGHVFEVTPPWQPGPIPSVIIEMGEPLVFHDGFVPVTAEHPARPGEAVITRAFDLGETVPHVAPEEPFPRNPFAKVISPIDVRVNGTRAQTGAVIGWPGEANRYRLDVWIPKNTAAGMARMTITAGGVTGPPIEIPVQPLKVVIRPHAPAPAILVKDGQPQVFHLDWLPVSPAHPARPGEVLITQAVDLGETRPHVAPETPFPKDHFADVVAKVEARVNGRPARTATLIGWPETVGVYRVDIHIPEETGPGDARVALTVMGATGPAREIPVR